LIRASEAEMKRKLHEIEIYEAKKRCDIISAFFPQNRLAEEELSIKFTLCLSRLLEKSKLALQTIPKQLKGPEQFSGVFEGKKNRK